MAPAQEQTKTLSQMGLVDTAAPVVKVRTDRAEIGIVTVRSSALRPRSEGIFGDVEMRRIAARPRQHALSAAALTRTRLGSMWC